MSLVTQKKAKRVLTVLLSAVLCCVVVFCSILLFREREDSIAGNSQMTLKPPIIRDTPAPGPARDRTLLDPLPDGTFAPNELGYMDFSSAREVNEEIVAWLTLYGVGIDYPVCHTTNNEFYLRNTAEKKPSSRGALFMDARNHGDLSEQNTFIHGHNLNNPQMFGKLKRFAEQNYFDSHSAGVLYTVGNTFSLQIYAVCYVNSNDPIYVFGQESPQERTEYLDKVKSKAVYYREVGVIPDDSLVLLSTCSYTGRFSDERLILVCLARPQLTPA